MDDVELWQRFLLLRSYVGLTDEDCLQINAVKTIVEPHFEALVEDFYQEISRHKEVSAVLKGGQPQVERLQKTLQNWLHEFFTGPYDQEYVRRHWRVGGRHVEIGLEQSYTQVAMSRLRTGILRVIQSSAQLPEEKRKVTEVAISRMMDLDLAIIQLAYEVSLLRKQQQAERLVAIGQMGGGIAHELRNPLNVLQTSLYLLKNSAQLDDAKRESHMERMQRQISLANRTISALSEFTRLGPPAKASFSIAPWLEETLRDNFPERHGEIQKDIEPRDLKVSADAAQLGIALRNLVANALEAMGNKGCVRIEVGLLTEPETGVFIDVVDQGPGIPESIQARLLEPLFTTKTRGLGLGLALVRSILERHGGSVEIKSSSSEGTVFRLKLPSDE